MKNEECRIKFPKALNRLLHSAFFLLPCLLLPLSAVAEPPSQRWLIVVDISRSMKDCAETVPQVAAVLVNSGMNGQMRRGDTLGIWTFNDDIYTGRFPLQEMSPELSGKIAGRVM